MAAITARSCMFCFKDTRLLVPIDVKDGSKVVRRHTAPMCLVCSNKLRKGKITCQDVLTQLADLEEMKIVV